MSKKKKKTSTKKVKNTKPMQLVEGGNIVTNKQGDVMDWACYLQAIKTRKAASKYARVKIDNDDILRQLVDEYIKEVGFTPTVVSFNKDGDPNIVIKRTLVTRQGFNRFLGVCHNWLDKYLNGDKQHGKKVNDKVVLRAYIDNVMYEHNYIGNSVGDISDGAFNKWYAQKFDYEATKIKIETAAIKRDQEKLKLDIMQKAYEQNGEEVGKLVITRALGNEPTD